MKISFLYGIAVGIGVMFLLVVLAGANRYRVGQPVPASVYTEPFDPCDPAYKFFRYNYGEPNSPKWQAAPDDWVQAFGNNERTMLLHAVSELRVVVAMQGKRLLALEALHREELAPKDPNEAKP